MHEHRVTRDVDTDRSTKAVDVPLRDGAIGLPACHEAVGVPAMAAVLTATEARNVVQHLGVTRGELVDLLNHRHRPRRLEGHLRAILGTLTVEEINADRQAFAQKMTDEAAVDLKKMGVNIDILTIQQISDEQGYLDALGKKRTAEVKRDAIIGEALAQRDATIQSALADQEGKTKRYEADVAIAFRIGFENLTLADYDAVIERARSLGIGAGISINPGTPLEAAVPYLEAVDVLNIMTVNPGWAGHRMIYARPFVQLTDFQKY